VLGQNRWRVNYGLAIRTLHTQITQKTACLLVLSLATQMLSLLWHTYHTDTASTRPAADRLNHLYPNKGRYSLCRAVSNTRTPTTHKTPSLPSLFETLMFFLTPFSNLDCSYIYLLSCLLSYNIIHSFPATNIDGYLSLYPLSHHTTYGSTATNIYARLLLYPFAITQHTAPRLPTSTIVFPHVPFPITRHTDPR
jgi:hypothetical protein